MLVGIRYNTPMQSGEYILDRLLVRIVRSICHEQSMTFRSYSGDWILELTRGNIKKRICGYKFPLNDSAAATIAQDKVAAYQVLTAGGVSAVEHILIRTKVTREQWPDSDMPDGFVVKPLMGTSGHGVRAFTDIKEAKLAIAQTDIEAWALSPRLDIVRETRYVMLDGEVLLAYDKRPVQQDGLVMFNLSKGATPQIIQPHPVEMKLAQDAMRVLNLRMAAVDIVETASGAIMILEVNDGFMMEYFARVSPDHEKIAYDIYGKIIAAMMSP